MNRSVATVVFLAFVFAFIFAAATAEETKKVEFPPKVSKWLSIQISFEAKGYELDTCMAICKKFTGADLWFELGTDPKSMPKVWYTANRTRLQVVLDDVLANTKFNWKVEGEKIIICKRQF